MRPQDHQEAAEFVAIQALSFIGKNAQRLGRFLAESGIGPATLHQTASDPHFLLNVLDFVLRDNEIVKEFASASQLTPDAVVIAREVLREALGDQRWDPT